MCPIASDVLFKKEWKKVLRKQWEKPQFQIGMHVEIQEGGGS